MRYIDREPVVRFIDRKYNQITTGQYYISTIISHNKNAGLDLDGGVPEWKVDPESTAKAIEICEYYKNNNISVTSNFIEPWEIEYDKKNFVLSKLQAAGIEVVTDKEQFDKILANQTILQKMTDDLSEFDKLSEKLKEEENITRGINGRKQLLEEQKEAIRKKNYSEFVEFVKSTEKYIPASEFSGFNHLSDVKNPVLLIDRSSEGYTSDYIAFQKVRLDTEGVESIKPVIVYPRAGLEIIPLDDYDSIIRRSDWDFTDDSLLKIYKENLKIYLEKKITLEQQNQQRLINEVGDIKTDLLKASLNNETIEADFARLDNSLRFNSNFEIESSKLGESVSVFPGSTGKSGLGIRHLIEERTKKDHLSEDEITALSVLVLDSVRNGDITRESDYQVEFTKNGIVAIVRKDFFGNQENWILTGFAYNESDIEKNREATEAIKTVIANYSNSDGYSYFRSQVGAVIASLDSNITQSLNKSTPSNYDTTSNEDSISITQMKTETIKERIHVAHPSDIVPYLNEYGKSEVENFGVVILNGSHDVKEIRSISVGTVNNAIAHPREVFKESIRNNAAAVIVFHNHPSNVVEPSDEDIQTTKKLVEAANIIGIPVLDHIIISDSEYNYFSFKENNILPKITQNMTLPDGNTYGFAHEGKIYLNPEIWNSEAAVHEYTHLWDSYTQRTNPELWQRGIEIFENTKLWEEVKADPNYSDIADNNDLVLSEVHARICGKMADKVLERILQEEGQLTHDTIIDWDKETWAYIANEIGFESFDKVNPDLKITTEELKQFLSMPVKDLFINERRITMEQSSSLNLPDNMTEKDFDTLADNIIQQAYENSGDGFNYIMDFKTVAGIAGKDVQWVKDNITNICDALYKYNDDFLLEFNEEEALAEENEINMCITIFQ